MPITFSVYLTHLANALQGENGGELAYLLRPTNPHGKDLVKEFRNPTVRVFSVCSKKNLATRLVASGTFLLRRNYRGTMGWNCYSICVGYTLCRKKQARRCFQGGVSTHFVSDLWYQASHLIDQRHSPVYFFVISWPVAHGRYQPYPRSYGIYGI